LALDLVCFSDAVFFGIVLVLKMGELSTLSPGKFFTMNHLVVLAATLAGYSLLSN
jgi:hypothetical protein